MNYTASFATLTNLELQMHCSLLLKFEERKTLSIYDRFATNLGN